jgi:hypothetical protein
MLTKQCNSITRGHNEKLIKKGCRIHLRKYYFSYRIIDTWNRLDSKIVRSSSLNMFKNRYDKRNCIGMSTASSSILSTTESYAGVRF